MAPAIAASLHPALGPGTIPCCCHPMRQALVAEQPRIASATADIKSQVIRAGIQFIMSSERAPHHPKCRYCGVLYPTIESIVLTTLNNTRPGMPPIAYQKM